MKRIAASTAVLAITAAVAAPAMAELKPGAKAPDFQAPAYLGGQPFNYKLSDALKKGPVVLYFFPSAYTKGCNIEARMFSEAADQFKAQKASVIGVTAGKTDQLAQFSKDGEHCAGKFPVAADAGAKIAQQYDTKLNLPAARALGELSGRTSYVIAPDGKILMAYSELSPDQHVAKTLEAVKAYRTKKP